VSANWRTTPADNFKAPVPTQKEIDDMSDLFDCIARTKCQFLEIREETDRLRKENAQLRELLNLYNLRGWMDSERLIKERDTLREENAALTADCAYIAGKRDTLRELVREGLRCMKEAKRRWAPTTTNSDADAWIERAEKALETT
jgi:hypothetical protein